MKRAIAISLWLVMETLIAFGQQSASSPRGQFSVSGTIVNAINGEAVRKAQVQLSPVGRPGETRRFETGSDGAFVFHGLTAGKYNLIVQARGFPQQLLDQHGAFNTGVAVGPDKVSSDIIFHLRPEAAISGRVLDEHNEPVREAQVLLFMRGNEMGKTTVQRHGQARSDDQGQYHFNHLQPGTYYVAVSAQPWYSRYVIQGTRFGGGPNQQKPDIDPALDVAYPVTYYPGATDSEEAGAIMLRAGDHISADFNLVPVQSLHITIPNPSQDGNRPMPNFRERVFGDANIFVQPQMSWSQDHVEVSGIAPGSYSLMLNRGGGPDRNQQVQEVSLQSNSELDLSQVQTLESIHGTLKLDGAQPPRNPIIHLQNLATGGSAMGRVDDQGTFTLQPPNAGKYVISLGAPGYAIRTISATGTHISGRTIDFTGTEPVELAIQASEGVGKISGIVKNGDHPISGVMVVLVPEDASDNLSMFRRDQSDSDGTFTLADVIPGHYTALAIQNGWEMEWGSPEALRPYLGKGTPVDVTAKQQLEIKIPAQ